MNNNNRFSSGSEHGRRHSHKYPPQDDIDSFLSSLQNSKNIFRKVDNESPNEPYDVEVSDPDACPTCNLARDGGSADEIRLEAIKRQILSKLGLKKKPTITLPVPRDVIFETLSRAGEYPADSAPQSKSADESADADAEELLENEPDDFYGRTSEIITFAEPGESLLCSRPRSPRQCALVRRALQPGRTTHSRLRTPTSFPANNFALFDSLAFFSRSKSQNHSGARPGSRLTSPTWVTEG